MPEAVRTTGIDTDGSLDLPAQRLLAQTLRRGFGPRWSHLREVRSRVLQRRDDSRCTLELTLFLPGRSEMVIGKQYKSDQFGLYKRMKTLWDSGFRGMPEPIGYLPDCSLLLLEKVEGPLAKELLLDADPRMKTLAARRCAEWLLEFQTAAPHGSEALRSAPCLEDLERWSGALERHITTTRGQARELFRALQIESAHLKNVPHCGGHGSYSPRHASIQHQRTAVFDWDGYDCADPCRDAARFIVATRRLALGRLGSIRALDGAVEIFIRTLRQGNPGAVSNLRFYEGVFCLQLAKYSLSHRTKQWLEKIRVMLDEGLRVLTAGDS